MIPSIQSFTLTGREILSDADPAVIRLGPSVLIDSSVTDSGSSPTNLLRPGLVLVKKTSGGKYWLATDASNGDRNTQATVSSLVAIAAGADLCTFKWSYKGGAIYTVTGGAADDTAAKWVTLLNADGNFTRDLIASASGSTLIITSRRSGKGEYFTVTDGTLNAMGGAADSVFLSNTQHRGVDADYVVLREFVQMADLVGTACDVVGATYHAGKFVTANLTGLTGDAQAALLNRGSEFN